MSISDYERVLIPNEKITALMDFLLEVAQGPQEAIGMLHATIRIVTDMNPGPHRTAEQLGQELTACLLLSEGQMQ